MIDKQNLRNADLLVYARPVAFRRGCGEWFACYELLSFGCFETKPGDFRMIWLTIIVNPAGERDI